MRNVLISIQPYYAFLIIADKMGWKVNQKKTIEVRKNFPKAKDWNGEVKIYCSQNKKSFNKIPDEYKPSMANLLGKVIGEFDCNYISCYECDSDRHKELSRTGSCLSLDEIIKYCNGNNLYGWQIDNLVIYKKLKELYEILGYCKYQKFINGVDNKYCGNCTEVEDHITYPSKHVFKCGKWLYQAPQNWVYIES